MYDQSGKKTWEYKLNSYGKVRNFKGDKKSDCPFLYQGQYEDAETGLYYNRFRYYSPDEGMYISQDLIRLNGGHNLYGYVNDINRRVDVLGLAGAKTTTLTLLNGNVYTAESGKTGGKTSGNPPLTDKESYSSTAKETAIEKTGSNPGYYGECAEINAINKAILAGETRESLRGATSDARFNRDRPESDNKKAAKKGDLAEACDYCKEVLKDLDIEDVNEGCGNK